jgi:hypothetical protein
MEEWTTDIRISLFRVTQKAGNTYFIPLQKELHERASVSKYVASLVITPRYIGTTVYSIALRSVDTFRWKIQTVLQPFVSFRSMFCASALRHNTVTLTDTDLEGGTRRSQKQVV